MLFEKVSPKKNEETALLIEVVLVLAAVEELKESLQEENEKQVLSVSSNTCIEESWQSACSEVSDLDNISRLNLRNAEITCKF